MSVSFTFPTPVSVPTLITPDDGAPPFWQFPDSWDGSATGDFLAAMLELETELGRLAEVREEVRAEAESPTAVIANTRAALAARRQERIALERDREEDAIFDALIKEYGGEHRVARIRTREGSIMLRPMTSQESDLVATRCSNPQLTEIAKAALHKDATVQLVRHPSRAKFDEIMGLYISLWGKIYDARDAVSSGIAEEASKKD
jgi:hypothetical protein